MTLLLITYQQMKLIRKESFKNSDKMQVTA